MPSGCPRGFANLASCYFPVFSSFFITASSFAFNDFFDFEIDRIYNLSVVYSIYGKAYGLLGNTIVAFRVSTAFVFGALSATASISYVVFSFFILSFFSNLGREIVQSIHDMEGDRLKKISSVATVHGPLVAAVIGSACYAVTVFLGPLLFLNMFEKIELFLLIIVIALEIGFLVSIFYLLKDPSKDRALKTIRQVNL